MAATYTKLGAYGGLRPNGIPAYIDGCDKLAEVVVTVTLDSSYPTGGYALDFSAYVNTVVWSSVTTDGDYKGHLLAGTNNDAATCKLKFYVMHTGSQVSNAVDLSTTPGTVQIRLIGERF